MWKTTLKVLLNKFLKKAQVWLKETGFTNVAYLGISLGIFLGFVPLFFLGFLKAYLVGAGVGIFVYVNWNMIVKLYKAKFGEKVDDILEDIKKKMDEKLGAKH